MSDHITPEELRAKLSAEDAPASTTSEKRTAIREEFAQKLAALPDDLSGIDLRPLYDEAQTKAEARALSMREKTWEPNPANLGHVYNGPIGEGGGAFAVNRGKWEDAKARQIKNSPQTRVIREMVAAALRDFTQSPLLVVEDPTGQALSSYCDALGDETAAAVVLISVSAKLLGELATRVGSRPLIFGSEAEARGVQQQFEALRDAVTVLTAGMAEVECNLALDARTSAEEVAL